MALPRDVGNLLCSGAGQPTWWIEQILYDDGLFLDWYHDIPGIRSGFRNREVDPITSAGERFHLFGSFHQLPVLLDHRVARLYLCDVVPRLVHLHGPLAHVYLRKYPSTADATIF